MKERKKDYWTSKSVAHARITRESRSQSHRSTPSALLEDTMHPVDLFLSAFAPCILDREGMDMDAQLGCARSRWWYRTSISRPRDHGRSWKCDRPPPPPAPSPSAVYYQYTTNRTTVSHRFESLKMQLEIIFVEHTWLSHLAQRKNVVWEKCNQRLACAMQKQVVSFFQGYRLW